jgi:dimethylglycine dehydrogenase
MFDLRQLNRAHSAQNMVKRRSGVKGSRDAGPTIRLVTMTIDTDVTLDEAILKDGECIGYVTSGGYEHHVQQSMALGYVPAALAADGTEVEVEINGEMYSAKVVGSPLYDPSGERMRA